MERTKADFKALRERVCLSQQDVADAIMVSIKSVKRWENPSVSYEAPADAWEYLENVLEVQSNQVSYALGVLAKQVEQLGGEQSVVPITYYRDQEMYDKYGRDDEPFGWANNVARMTAYELERRGIGYKFRYPNDGAVSTPCSKY